MLLEISVILILIIANGFFSSAEIAVIAARKSRIKALAEKGSSGAVLLAHIQSEPERFLATVQVGVTLLGSGAAAVGGVAAIESVKPLLDQVTFLQPISGFLAVSFVVIVISYFSLVLGELIPKSLALKYPEQIALVVARPFNLLARLLRPFVDILTAPIYFFLGPLVGKVVPGTFISEDEIKFMLKEGKEKGVFDQTEQELIHSVFEFTDISVKEVMLPRPKMQAIQVDTSTPELLKYVAENMLSRYPVYKDGVSDIIGILYFKDLMAILIQNKPILLKELLHPAYFVPETMQVSRLLKELQRRKLQMAIVINEYGSVEGLVTMEDLVEEIVGEIEDEYDVEERSVERLKDGSLAVDASLSIRDLNNDYGLPVPEAGDYETLGGFVMAQLQDMPKGGEIIQYGNYKFTIVAMDGRRISKLKVEKKTTLEKVQKSHAV